MSLARGEGGGQQFPELDLGALSLEGWDAGFQAHTAIELQCGGERRLGFGQNGGQVAFLPGGVRTQQLGGSLGLLGAPVLLGIEGTGAYGVGLVCHLQAQNVTMIEVDWPDRMAAVGARRVASITGEKQVFGR